MKSICSNKPLILENNKVVDVYNETIDPPSWQRPKNLADTYPSQRWRKYLGNLHTKRHRNHRLHYSRYLCRKWNAKAFKDEDLLHRLSSETPNSK